MTGSLGAYSISVITVTYESEKVIEGWLDCMCDVLPEAQIIVVDNSSTDRTVEIARSHAANALVIETGGNLGFARGCDIGAQNAERPVLWFLNPDARLLSVERDKLAEELGTEPFGLVETAMKAEDGTVHHEVYRHRGAVGEWLAHVVTPLWPRRAGVTPWSVSHGSDWASGASLLVSASDFRELGAFDPAFFLLYEDRHLAWKAHRAHMPIRRSEAIVVTHDPGTSSEAENLGVRRRSWALLSWLEYVAATASPSTARASALSILGSLRLLGWLASLLGLLGMGRTRIAQRARAAGEVRRHVIEVAERLRTDGYYPRAASALGLRTESRP